MEDQGESEIDAVADGAGEAVEEGEGPDLEGEDGGEVGGEVESVFFFSFFFF